MMNRVFVFACVIAGLSALGCNGYAGSTKPVASFAPPEKEPSQPTEPKKGVSGDPTAARDDAPVLTTATSAGKVLLSPSDFTFVGSYPFSANNQASYGMGLTCHRVKGQLRFLTFAYEGRVNARLIEFALPAEVGQKITSLTAAWDDIWSPAHHPNLGGGDEYGLWMEPLPNGAERLWTTYCTDYPADGTKYGQASYTGALSVRTLKSDGTITDLAGEYGLTGVGQRAIYGGVQPIPQWFRDKYGITQPYAAGWGGYASRMAQGLVCSMGLEVLAIPNVTAYKADAVIPTTDFKILADHRSGTTGRDWYASGKPTKFDRGQRNADVVNTYDSGTQWLSPAPDGFGRFVWGDSFYNTGGWIDGPNKGGFIVIGTFTKGKAYYKDSTLHNSGRHAELQIFDPNDFGKVLQGKKNPWNVQPTDSKLLTADLAPLGLLYPNGGNNPFGGVAGATFDPTTKCLYLWCPQVNGKYGCCLVVYKVTC